MDDPVPGHGQDKGEQGETGQDGEDAEDFVPVAEFDFSFDEAAALLYSAGTGAGHRGWLAV